MLNKRYARRLEVMLAAAVCIFLILSAEWPICSFIKAIIMAIRLMVTDCAEQKSLLRAACFLIIRAGIS